MTIIAYHGTEHLVTAFDNARLQDTTGHAFAINREFAREYAGDEGYVIEAQLDVQNPLEMSVPRSSIWIKEHVNQIFPDMADGMALQAIPNAQDILQNAPEVCEVLGVEEIFSAKHVQEAMCYVLSKALAKERGMNEADAYEKVWSEAIEQWNKSICDAGYDAVMYRDWQEGSTKSDIIFVPNAEKINIIKNEPARFDG